MILPTKVIQFWFKDSAIIFLRVFKNTLYIVEEDLAVGLMFRLLFTPLFHDASFVGRIISFVFRLIRIFSGVVAFAVIGCIFIVIVLLWYLAPVLFIASYFIHALAPLSFIFLSIFLTGIALFIDRLVERPEKALWQIKAADEIWQTTKLQPKEAVWGKLLVSKRVTQLLDSLELQSVSFKGQDIPLSLQVLDKAYQLAKIANLKYVTEEYFWVGMLYQIPNIESLLYKLNVRLADFDKALIHIQNKHQKWKKLYIWDEEFSIRHLRGVNRGWLGAPTPALDSVSTDLTDLVRTKWLDPFVGRGAVISQVVTILSQEKDRNVLLVGEPGVGKTTLVTYLAQLIINGDAPESLATKRLVSLDLTKLLSTVNSEGELARRVQAAFEEVQFIEDIIIFIDEVHNFGIGDVGKNYNIYSLLQPYLESDSFQFIASTEASNYARIIEKNGSFSRLFHKVDVPPASLEDTIEVIQQKAADLSKFKGIEMSFLAIRELVEGSNKLIHDRVLPDSALSILEECEVEARNACHHADKSHSPNRCNIIDTEVVKIILSRRVNVPILALDNNQKDKLLHLEDQIHQRFIDQEEAVRTVSRALRRGATSLKEANKPIGSFLFVGPTGVGKTELAKALATIYFLGEGDKARGTAQVTSTKDAPFIRFDMSEYQTEESVTRLLGDFDTPGELTEAVKRRPYCLLLLDEFEKADKRILSIFLQVLDDGRLTDGSGKTVDFSSTIIIATSNAGSLLIAQGLNQGKTMDDLKNAVRDELLGIFKPELINRFDDIVLFKNLKPEELEQVVHLKLKGLKKLLEEQGYLIEFSSELVTELARKGFDPVLGARPLNRLIQDTLESKLSVMILEGKLPKGEVFTIPSTFISQSVNN